MNRRFMKPKARSIFVLQFFDKMRQVLGAQMDHNMYTFYSHSDVEKCILYSECYSEVYFYAATIYSGVL